MATKNFSQFTQEPTPADSDHVVGYRSASANGERRTLLSVLANYVLSKITWLSSGGRTSAAAARGDLGLGSAATYDAATTPTADAIPRADSTSTIAAGWLPDATTSSRGAVQLAADGGTTAGQAVQANDGRLSNARTPTAHASTHQHGGSDEISTATPAANAIPKAGAGGTLASGWLPTPTTTSLGGVKRNTGSAGQFVSGISTDGDLQYSTPTGGGDVTGPSSAVNNGVALFDGTSGKLIKDGGVLGSAAFSASSAFATAAQGSLADTALQPFVTGKTLYVDDVAGNNSTALTGRIDRPYKTIGAALADAAAGDLIYVRPGTYAEQVTNTAGVHWFFAPGSVINPGTGTGWAFTQPSGALSYIGGSLVIDWSSASNQNGLRVEGGGKLIAHIAQIKVRTAGVKLAGVVTLHVQKIESIDYDAIILEPTSGADVLVVSVEHVFAFSDAIELAHLSGSSGSWFHVYIGWVHSWGFYLVNYEGEALAAGTVFINGIRPGSGESDIIVGSPTHPGDVTVCINGHTGFLFDNALTHGTTTARLILLEFLTPVARQVATQHSLTGGGNLTADRTLSLVNDTASPGANKVYGTNASGVRGWKDDPAGGDMSNPMTTAGDIITGGTGGTPQRLAIGSSGQVLKVVSGAPAWAAESVATHASTHRVGGSDSLVPALSTLTFSSTTEIVFTDAPQRRSLALTGNITFTGSGYSDGRAVVIFIAGDSSARTVAFPSDWVFVGAKPTEHPANKAAVFSLECISSSAAGVRCVYSLQS